MTSMRAPAAEEARVKLKTLISAGAEKLILDLRDCADGQVEDGTELANLFLKNGVIYQSKDREGKVVAQAEADPEKSLTDLPMAVLINGSTAGPAEIVAGALKDRNRAKVVGERSFGAGSSQKRITLKNGSVLILSTAKYYTPSGKMIQEENVRSTGIRPDIQSPDSDRRQELLVEAYYDEKEDAAKYNELRAKVSKEQLRKALEILGAVPQQAKRAA
jgi:carboxyl-terminal processing protease